MQFAAGRFSSMQSAFDSCWQKAAHIAGLDDPESPVRDRPAPPSGDLDREGSQFLLLVRPRGAADRAALLMKSADQPALLVLSAEVGR